MHLRTRKSLLNVESRPDPDCGYGLQIRAGFAFVWAIGVSLF